MLGHIILPLLQPHQGNLAVKSPQQSGYTDQPAETLQQRDNALSCVFIGEGSLLTACVRIAQAAGLQVFSIVSPDDQVRQLAQAENIPVVESIDQLWDITRERPIQYLFSIVNYAMLPAAVVQSISGMVINYHDGPLPRYAGLHASSWAIINGEQQHGITWHRVESNLDIGDILKQKMVDIEAEDTALTLNVKCYEAAIQSFGELLEEIVQGTLQPRKHVIGDRSYYSGKKRPARTGIISFDKSAEDIDRMYRALQFGTHHNLLGLPKICLSGEYLVVSGLKVSDVPTVALPGTITHIDEQSICIATATQQIVITELRNLFGVRQDLASTVERTGLRTGQVCEELTAENISRTENLDAVLSAFQRYWAKKLEKYQPSGTPFSLRVPVPEARQHHYMFNAMPAAMSTQADPDQEACTTLFTTAFAIFLARINSTDSVHFGFTTNALLTSLPELPPVFSKYVPFQVEFHSDTTLKEVFEAVRKELKVVIKNQTYQFDLIARFQSLRNRKDFDQGPTFPVSLILTDSLLQLPDSIPGELALVLSPNSDQYVWIGDASRLNEEAMQRISSLFEVLLQGVIQSPDTTVGKLPLLPAAARRQILFDWNQTEATYDREGCMHQLFETQAEQSADAIALLFEGHSLTYRELNEKANQLAHHLQSLGVGPEVLVGISMEKSMEMIIGVMGILKAGGAYVPLDPYAPKDRLALLLQDLQLKVLLTQPPFAERFENDLFHVLQLNQDLSQFAHYPVTNPVSGVSAQNLAYIIYTSGSTGIPKGVMVRHRPVINLIEWVTKTFSITPADRVLFVNSLGFDLSVYDIFGLLAAGGSIRIASRRELGEPQVLLDILQQEPITFWDSAPATLSQLIPFYRPEISSGSAKLRLVFLSGDWVPLTMPGWIQSAFPGTEVISLGGATEATVWSNFFRVGDLNPQWVSIPYGRPIQNARYHVLDARLEPVPVGVAGELFIGGECLADGYFNRPELTAQKFIPDPFSNQTTDRLYRTGDLARYMPDGNIEFLGRLDHQVKIRGYRVELGEIEAILSQRNDLQEVLVVAAPDPGSGKRLIAYLVAKPGFSVSNADIRRYLRNKLPEYMIPSAFIWLAAFPLNTSGKIDRKALPLPTTVAESSVPYEAPHSSTEALLTSIWGKYLNLDKVGITDNFFEIGGHSLLAGRVISEIQAQTGKLLPLSIIFANPTIQKLAPFVQEDKKDELWHTLVPIRTTGSKTPLFCFHPISGDVEYVYKLAAYLPDDQPIYGIIARGINGEEAPFEKIDEAASEYLTHILAKYPEGSYSLAGYSYGGFVAYETAQQLTRMGKKVENLILFDTYPTNVGRKYRGYALEYVLLSTLNLLTSPQNIRDFFRNNYWKSLVRKGRSLIKLLASYVGLWRYQSIDFPVITPEPGVDRDQVLNHLMFKLAKSCGEYQLQPYSGKVIFIRAVEGAARYLHNCDFGWKKNARDGVVMHDIFGVDHLKLFEKDDHVREVAHRVNLHLSSEQKGNQE